MWGEKCVSGTFTLINLPTILEQPIFLNGEGHISGAVVLESNGCDLCRVEEEQRDDGSLVHGFEELTTLKAKLLVQQIKDLTIRMFATK